VGNILQCQCNGISLSDAEKQFIAANYADCLCRNCLLAIKKETVFRSAEENRQLLNSIVKTR
jgi:hypothetical protein